MDASYKFSFDALPVRFGSIRVPHNGGGSAPHTSQSDISRLNAAMREISTIIWREGGFRFRHLSTNSIHLTYLYRCSQDSEYAPKYDTKVPEEKRRDGRRMARFQCESRLYMRPCFQTRTLSLPIHHKWHEPYEDVELPPMVEEFLLGYRPKLRQRFFVNYGKRLRASP